MTNEDRPQRIAGLTPLAEVLESLQTAVEPVMPFETEVPAAVGLTLAADAVAASGRTADALAPGEGVLPAGTVLRLAGARLRRIDVAALMAVGIERVAVRRPRLRVVSAGSGITVEAAAAFVASAIKAESGRVMAEPVALDAALNDRDCDAVVAIGGTGSGYGDNSVTALAKAGRVAFHGIAIGPGEATALGFAGTRPVLLLPGRLDAAVAGWLLVGRRLLARLAFRLVEEQPFTAELSRKIASPLGLAEVVPVRRRLGTVEPLAGACLAPQALARSDGWVLVPADSEGFSAGTRVPVRPWP